MIELRFTRDFTLMGAVVRTYTWFEFDHVEIVVTADEAPIFGGQQGFFGARPDGGVLLRSPGYHKPLAEQRCWLDCSPLAKRKALEFAWSQRRKPYDWSAIAGIALHRDWREADSWICSELIAAMMEEADDRILNGDRVNRFSPRDVFISPRVHAFVQ